MPSLANIVGERFNRLVVLERVQSSSGKGLWRCLCDCGNVTFTSTSELRKGHTTSCGCYRKDKNRTHGMTKHPLFPVWKTAKNRVINEKAKDYHYYGGRGIRMCQEWENSFEAFLVDMGPTWKEGLELDRIDTNGDYCKENCRWVDKGTQAHNKRKRKGLSSKYIGVYFNKKANKFKVHIEVNGDKEYLGMFLVEEDAALAYDNRSEELYGDRPNETSRHTKDLVEAIKEANEAEAL